MLGHDIAAISENCTGLEKITKLKQSRKIAVFGLKAGKTSTITI
jgi:hypothetical protein